MGIQHEVELFWLDPKDSIQVRTLKIEYNIYASQLNLYKANGWKEGQQALSEQLDCLRARIDQYKQYTPWGMKKASGESLYQGLNL